MANEEARFSLVEKDGAFEIRDYEPCFVATMYVDGPFEDAGRVAFGRLFRFISGANRTRQSIAMTAPVLQQESGSGWEISFSPFIYDKNRARTA
jgi:hypothetical protein